MAVPTRFMSALIGLGDIRYMDVRLLGQHERLLHYAVRSQTGDEHKVTSFNITVDHAKEQVTVENPSKQLIFIGNGGLNRAEDMMSVFSALNYFRGPMLTVCGNELLDKTENSSSHQLRVSYHATKDGFIIKENKDLRVPDSPSIFVNQQKRVSAVTMNFYYKSHPELSPSKKALALMATLKLMHYHYSFHLHLMPSDIPHLMPPGTPQEPLSGLESVGELLMKPSCIVAGGNIMCSDILDGKTLSTLFVVEYDRRNPDGDLVDILVRDQFGVLQFGAKFYKSKFNVEVYDRKKNYFGLYGGAPRSYRFLDEEKMYLRAKPAYLPDQRPDTKVYEIHNSDDDAVVAQLYLMNEWQVVKLGMDSKVSVHWKAVILAHSATIALFDLKLWSRLAKPFDSEYQFRRTL